MDGSASVSSSVQALFSQPGSDPFAALCGRAQELTRLTEILEDTGTGTDAGTRVVEISGDPWIGKTALLSVLGDLARSRGWTVASGAAGPLPCSLPFGVFSDALNDLLLTRRASLAEGFPAIHMSWLAGIFPALAPLVDRVTLPADATEMHHACHAVRALLERIGGSERLLLVIDDLHWADEASVHLFRHLVRHPPAAGVLLVTAHRPRQTDGDLRMLLGESGSTGRVAHLHLPPLATEDLGLLLAGDVDPHRRRTLQQESGGNPGLLQALAAFERTAGEQSGEADSAPSGGAPVRLRREFRGLSPLGWTVVHAAALVCEDLDARLLAAAAQVSEADVWTGIDELVRCDVLSVDETERTFRFRNTLLRAMARQSSGTAWRLGAHARAADVLRRRNAPPPKIARHLGCCVVAGDEDGIRILEEAARLVLWERPAQAAAWLRTVLNIGPLGTETDRAELSVLLATALALGGELTGSLALFDTARPSAPDPAGTGLLCHTDVLRLLGQHTRATELLNEALVALPADACLRRARYSVALLATALDDGTPCQPPDALRELTDEVPDDPALRVLHLALLALAAADGGEPEPDTSLLREARKLVDDLPDTSVVPRLDCLYWLGRAEDRLGHHVTARSHLERALRLATRHGQHHLVPGTATMLGSVLLRQGDHDGAGVLADHAHHTARRIGSEIQLRAAEWLTVRAAGPLDLDVLPAPALPEAVTDLPLGPPSGHPACAGAAPEPAGEPPAVVSGSPPSAILTALNRLSRREREISCLVSDGRTNQQIARALGLSHKTVETYLARIFKKLDLCSRAQLATMVGRSDHHAVTS